jgi:nitrogen-specific signal transduction histidine kinase
LIWANFLDHTEEVRLQEQIFQIKKLEGLGHLAAGIAHEFNNVLAIIQGQFALLSRNLPNDESIGRRVKVIDNAVARGASTVRQLLVLARRRPVKKEFIRVEELLAETCKLVQSLFPENITLRLEAGPGLPGIVGDRDQLGQAFLNLIINAKDSMPDGGTVSVAARLDPRDSKSARVRVEVSDEGSGIPPELLDKIFDPFFTTKEEGKGTGLGLSLVATVARSHLGWVEIEARSPRGTTFRVFLPAAPRPEAEAAKPPLAPVQRDAGGASILLIENEADVRSFERHVLADHGFRVVECPSADEAWALLEKDPSAFAVAITDLGMPGLGGEGFCQRAQKLASGPKLMVQTGNMDPAVLERLKTIGVHHILLKPFSPEELLAGIRTVLDSERGRGDE